jgi:hypothetical protein
MVREWEVGDWTKQMQEEISHNNPKLTNMYMHTCVHT